MSNRKNNIRNKVIFHLLIIIEGTWMFAAWNTNYVGYNSSFSGYKGFPFKTYEWHDFGAHPVHHYPEIHIPNILICSIITLVLFIIIVVVGKLAFGNNKNEDG